MDEKLLLLINQTWTNPTLDRVMTVFSSFDVWWPILAVTAVILLVRGSFRLRAFVMSAAILVGVNDGIVSKSLKRIVDRPRPHQAVADLRLLELQKAKPRLLAVAKPLKVKYSRVATGDVEGRSFPSSHTMNTLAVAIAGAAFLGWRAWWLFLVAGIVSYSRVYTGSHWPSDVATSLFLGAGCSLLILALLELAWRKRGAFVLPKIHAQHPALFRS